MSYDFKVTLYRDSLSTPWGFRLEGGHDYGFPLTIQRVFTGSPASTDLQRGDIILSIHNRDTSHILHQEANDLIRNSGGSLSLAIRRSHSQMDGHQALSYRPQSSYLPPNPTLPAHPPAVCYSAIDQNYIRSRPIEKPRDPKPILSQTGSPIIPGETPSFSSRVNVKRYRPSSTMPLLPTTNFSSHSPSSPLYNHNSFINTNSSPMPYDKNMASQIHHSLTKAIHSPRHVPSTSAYPAFAPPSPIKQVHNYSAYQPDTFDNHHHPHNHQHHHQNHHQQAQPFKVTSSFPTYHQPEYNNHQEFTQQKSPLPKVVNLQYNTPIGLYSKDNIKEELHKKVGNAMDFQFNPSSEF